MNNEYQKPRDSNRREEKETSRPKGVDAVASCCRPSCLYYVAFFLLAWSDRMWDFCLGLLLVDLGDKTLRLPGIYGFARGGMVLVFCGVLGQWVDKTTRLKAARFCLLAQNGAIVLCATSLLLTLRFLGRIKDALGGHLEGIIFTITIILAVVAYMATTGSQIILEKDWIVVISDKNKERLASMNARMRAIDMVCSFVAPIVLGQAMQFSSLEMAAGVVIAWHVGSAMVSYVVLRRIYIALPRLAVKNEVDVEKVDGDINNPDRSDSPQYSALLKHEKLKPEQNPVLKSLKIIVKGWPLYVRQSILFAGLAYAALYLTVLAFDSITVGYSYALGVPESILGLCTGLSGVTGMVGTFIYPFVRKRVGLEITGRFALAAQVSCLSLCVISIWLPGSPSIFYPNAIPVKPVKQEHCVTLSLNSPNISTDDIQLSQIWSTSSTETASGFTVLPLNLTVDCPARPAVSISVFLSGVVLSRIGLWMADLAVMQIFQESIAEAERGIVNGVQVSLNMSVTMIKFIMVIVAPHPHTFGVLIIVSFSSIFLANVLFGLYTRKSQRRFLLYAKYHYDPTHSLPDGLT